MRKKRRQFILRLKAMVLLLITVSAMTIRISHHHEFISPSITAVQSSSPHGGPGGHLDRQGTYKFNCPICQFVFSPFTEAEHHYLLVPVAVIDSHYILYFLSVTHSDATVVSLRAPPFLS
jgi:hypothetical protein